MPRWTAPCRCCTGRSFDYARYGIWPSPSRRKPRCWCCPASRTDLRAHRQPGRLGGVRMMDTDTSVMQERIGQLCREFKLPTMGTVGGALSGHGDALPTFLEVLEQEAEDRRPAHQPAAPSVPAPLGQDLGNLRAPPDASGATATAGPSGPGQFRGSRPRAGFRAPRHRQDPRAVRLGHRLVDATGAYRLQDLLAGGPAPTTAQTGQLRLPATAWATSPKATRVRGCRSYERRSLGITSNRSSPNGSGGHRRGD